MMNRKSILVSASNWDDDRFHGLPLKANGKQIGQCLIIVLVVFVLFHRFFVQCGVPDVAKYLLDLITVALLCLSICRTIRVNNALFFQGFLISIIVFIGSIISLLGLGGWKVSAISYIFDLRSILRPFLFILVCYNFIDERLIEKIRNLLIIYNLVNAVYIVYQYFTLEVDKPWMRGDNLNGFFGTATGGNIFVNVVLVLTTIITLERYIEKSYGLKITLFFMVLNIVIATLIELKMFYIEIVVIFVIFFLEPKKTVRLKPKTVLGIIFMLPIGALFIRFMVLILYKIYPSMNDSLSLDGILTMTANGGYTGGRDLNRLSFVQGINDYIFHEDIIKNIFGQGIGSAAVNTPFFTAYESTHYTWFSSAYIYVELGTVGLLLYITSILILFKFSIPSKKKYMLCNVILTLIMLLYNETMKTEACYLVAFALVCGLTNITPLKKLDMDSR